MTEVRGAGVELADTQRLLSLFAQGIGGRFLHLLPVERLKGQFRFAPPGAPTSDGTALYLPERVDSFDIARHNLGVYKIAILHQLGFYEFGTFAFSLDEACANVPGFARLELEKQLVDDVDFDVFFRAFEAPAVARRLFQMLEDHRIDRAVHRFYPGARADLERNILRARDERVQLATLESAAELLEALLQYTLGADRMALERRDATSLGTAIFDLADRLNAREADVYSTVAATIDCYELLAHAGIARPSAARPGLGAAAAEDLVIGSDAPDGASEGSTPMDDALVTPEGVEWRGEFQPELVQRRLRLDALEHGAETFEHVSGMASGDALESLMEQVQSEILGERTGDGMALGREPGSAEARAGAFTDKLRRRIERDRSKLRMAFGELSGHRRSFLYDEWNFHDQVYMKGWCRVFEERLEGGDLSRIRDIRQKHRALFARVRQQFQYVKPQSYQRTRKVLEGEDVDLEAALEAWVDRRIGRTPDERLYSRRDKMRREVAAALLVDLSASTDDPVPDRDAPEEAPPPDPEEIDPFLHDFYRPLEALREEPERRRVIDLEKEALVLMCDALETLGDSYGIYGFSGYGHEEVEYYVAKEFEQGLSARVLGAIAAMRPRRSTRMGAAIRHTTRKLQRQDVRLKVMIIVSDGYPQDWDYGPDRTDNEFGIQDTARALAEAQSAGIETFCITIDRSGHDYLRRMCPARRYLVIDEVERLPQELSKVYRALTV